MRQRSRSVIGMAIFTTFALTVTWMVYNTLRRDIAGPTYTYSAIFSDASGMGPGDDVRVAGVRVGRVDRVSLQGTTAKVQFRVQRDQRLYRNTVASVTYQSIIGQRYLGLAQGPGDNHDTLPDHGQIPIEHTNPSLDVSYMLNGFEPLFAELDPEQIDNISNATVLALQGNKSSMLTLITQASQMAETFAGPDEVLSTLIVNLDRLMADLAGQSTNLERMIRQSRDTMVTLANQREPLIDSVGSINATMARLSTIVDNISPDLEEFIGRQPGLLNYGVNDGRERFAYMAANLPYVLQGLARVTQSGTYSDVYACELDFGLWRGLFNWFRAFVGAATASEGLAHQHSAACR
ncbi:MlaD family protein [Mycolicibacter sp. MYC123]|uniref:MlaD family protein n=2 Tax=Mycolicibacter TaxID=1073531 RepID=A0ABU5YFV1_9MYCO|nr:MULTISPECIES: MlaD family protein [unclassified Mycolicibacter]MEB3048931.1 MlaD family protein [Mycolicibacter sp. MYC123]MEB3070356.1 MlaD family protein [Mycolicibacter sp. MYC017]